MQHAMRRYHGKILLLGFCYEAFHAPDHGCSSVGANTHTTVPLKSSLVEILGYHSEYFLPCCFFGHCLAKKEIFAYRSSIHKAHVSQELGMATYIGRLIELQSKFPAAAYLLQNNALDVSRLRSVAHT